MTSPTSRTLDHLRRQGYVAGVVERFISGAGERGQGIRRDFLGIIDVVAAKPGMPIVGIQTTSIANVSARLNKARGVSELRSWLGAARFEVHGWAMRNGRWHVKIVELTLDDLGELSDAVLVQPPRQRSRSRWQPGSLF